MTVDASVATEEDRTGLLVDVLVAPVPPLVIMARQIEEALSRAEQCEAVTRALQAKVGRRQYRQLPGLTGKDPDHGR
jgi:hypothetical protein